MALVDLQSDLSKFRAAPKSSGQIAPENSSAKSSRSFGAFQPITERISEFSPKVQKPTNVPLESRLDSTKLDDIVKVLQQELIINSVSRYSPTNAVRDSNTVGRISLEKIVSRFSDIPKEEYRPKLNTSNVLILKSESGEQNNVSPIDVNTLLATAFDKIGQSPNVFRIEQSDRKESSSPAIQTNTSKTGVLNPDTPTTGFVQTIERQNQSPSVNVPTQTDDKVSSSPDVMMSSATENIGGQSPDVFTLTQTTDRTGQSPDVFAVTQTTDRTGQSPDITRSIVANNKESQSPDITKATLALDKSNQSPDVLPLSQTPDKSTSSPAIGVIQNDAANNIVNPDIGINKPTEGDVVVNPNTLVTGKPLAIDRTNQSVVINKDLVSPINNILNPNIVLDRNEITFDRKGQSPDIFKDTQLQGLVVNPNTPVVRIENGTYHLIDESRLNLDGLPIKFERSSRLTGKTPLQVADTADRYSGQTLHNGDVSRFNPDGIPEKTNPIGRHETPEKSFVAIKGTQAVNFFTDRNGVGFSRFPQFGQTKLNTETSELGFTKSTGVNYFDVGSAVTTAGFTVNSLALQTELIRDASRFGWKGGRQQAPANQTFTTFTVPLESKIANTPSTFRWEGGNTNAPSVNFLTDTNGKGFQTFATQFATAYTTESSKFGFKGTLPTPINVFTDTNSSGFTIKQQSGVTNFNGESSRFTFSGNGRQSPQANFFLDLNNSGFERYTNYLQTTYKPKTSRFTWVGTKQEAPEVNFFYIPNENPNAIAGFTRLFNDKSSPKLSDAYSRLSFAGTNVRSNVRPVPYTTYFGFTPAERTGFMVNMSTFDGTLYPTISPTLKFNADPSNRTSVEIARAIRGGMQTVNNEKYAPNSLGPRPWIDGTLSSTLDAQIPDGVIKTGASASSYRSKYERYLKDGTSNLGFLTKWAITRRSPSPLDNQYNKFSLPESAYNTDPISQQPFVVRGIQRKDEVENQRWGFGITFDDGIVRGGAITQAERIAMDVVRVGKWSISVKGLLWNAKQVGLQAMNPVVDVNPAKPESGIFGISSTLAYNPLSLIGNVAGAPIGIRLPRHGLLPFSPSYLNRYEDATVARELKHQFTSPDYTSFEPLARPTVGNKTTYNRLIGLMKELLPNSFKPVVAKTDGFNQTISNLTQKGLQLVKELTGQTGISRISSNYGGPQSFLGIGGTQINRAHHPYLTHYTTTPLLMLTGEQKEPQFPTTAKRDTYYAATAIYADTFNDALRTIAYNLPKGPYERNDQNLPRDVKKVTGVQPTDVSRIEKQNPFDGGYDLFKNRLRKVKSTDVYRTGQISEGLHPDNTDGLNPIKAYRALSYDKLSVSRDRRRSKNGRTDMGDLNDFRADLTDSVGNLKNFSSDPAVIDYAQNNLEDRHGFGKHGKVGVDRSKPFQNAIFYGKQNGVSVPVLKDAQSEFRGDRINIINYKRGKFDISKDFVYEVGAYKNNNIAGAEDLIEFYFTGVVLRGTESRPAEAIAFRATFGNISDSHAAEWSSIKYMGRADPLYVYQGYQRDISFDFTVHISSRDELKASWRKLNHLASWTAPEYTKGGFMRGPIVRLNIGNLYRKMPGYLESIRFNFDNNETTWETAKLRDDQLLDGANGTSTSPGALQLPKTIKVDCVFVPIGVYRPEYNGIMYSLYDDSAGGQLENGLVPNNDVRVNYFKTYDVDEAGSPQTNDSSDNRRYYTIPPGDESKIPTITPENRESLSNTISPNNSDGTQNAATVPNTNAGSTPGNITQNLG